MLAWSYFQRPRLRRSLSLPCSQSWLPWISLALQLLQLRLTSSPPAEECRTFLNKEGRASLSSPPPQPADPGYPQADREAHYPRPISSLRRMPLPASADTAHSEGRAGPPSS